MGGRARGQRLRPRPRRRAGRAPGTASSSSRRRTIAALVRESRGCARCRERPERCSTPTAACGCSASASCCRWPAPAAASIPAPPLDISRTIEEALTAAPLDFVHVHEPFAPSASSVALRHSRSLNVGTFHAPAERVLSTQVARRFVELLLRPARRAHRLVRGHARADAAHLPGRLPAVLRPGATRACRARAPPTARSGSRSATEEERAALRLFLRALRRLPTELDWEATVFVPDRRGADRAARAPARPRARALRRRTRAEDAVLASADVVVAASHGVAPAPGLLVRALGAGAVPVASHLRLYEEVLAATATSACCSSPATWTTLTAQLERLIRDDGLLAGPARERAARPRRASTGRASPTGLRGALRRGRRAPPRPAEGDARGRARGSPTRQLIDVDLHMHTDHSQRLRDAGRGAARHRPRRRASGAIAVTDHNEISGALDARAKAAEFGVKVIVGRGGQDRRPGRGDRPLHRGEDPARDDARGDDRRDQAPGRARLRAAPVRPHALGARLRAPARGGRGHRRDRGLQPARRDLRLQRGGRALRGQVPDRGRRRL